MGITFTDGSWSRASLPLKLGGIAPGTLGDRALVAYISATTRTLPEVTRRIDIGGIPALRQAAPGFDRRITGAIADLIDRGVEEMRVFFTEEEPNRAPRQKDLVDRIRKKRYNDLLEVLDESGRGQLRSASGPGSASFFTLPTRQNTFVEDSLLRAAVVRRLGGRVIPKDDKHAQRRALVGGEGGVVAICPWIREACTPINVRTAGT